MVNKISMRLQADWPINISYDKSEEGAEDFYSSIKGAVTEKSSIFYERKQTDIFLLAMAIGKEMNSRKKIKKPSQSIRRTALTEREAWQMCSVALSEEGANLDTLADPAKIVRICEEYANAGLRTLLVIDKRISDVGFQQYEELLEDAVNGRLSTPA